MRNPLIRALIAGAAVIGGLFAQTVPLTQDAYVNPGVGTNFGTATTINVGGAANSQGLVQFDLSALPSGVTASQIAKATLSLFVNKLTAPGSVNISVANGPWAETSVNGTSSVVAGAAVASGIAAPAANNYLYVDATTAVQNWINGGATNSGFIITPAGGVSVLFDSKESSTTSHPATLTIILTNSGATGATGTNGATGATGATGAAGSNGTNGATGATGSNGTNGSTGATGATGSNGTNGSTGATGATGSNGTNGSTGATGATGSNGTNGSTGATGASGSNGTNGSTGATGATGSNGTNGSTGATGASGSNGTNGSTGATGATGSNGTNGSTGATGATGSNGTNGSTGATGATGSNGTNGSAGATGSNGINGSTGATGATGSNGTNGSTGATGATGTGTTGATGATGATGTNGTNGATGATGTNGTNGSNGSNGATGATGATGPAGTNGTGGGTLIFFATSTSAQTLNASTSANLTLNTTPVQASGTDSWNGSTTLTVGTAGNYLIQVSYGCSTSFTIIPTLVINGSVADGGVSIASSSYPSTACRGFVSVVKRLNQSDTIAVQINNFSGTTNASITNQSFSVFRY